MTHLSATSCAIPHRIEHDVGAGVRGEPLHRLVNARFGVVDKMIGAEPSGVPELLGSGCGSDDRGAQRLSDLHCCEANASGGAEDHETLARGKGGPCRERVVSRKVRDEKGCAFREGKTCGKSDDLVHRHDGLFGIAAGLHADNDLLASRECIDVWRRLSDNSGSLLTDDEWKRGAVLILALNHQKVGEIDARRFEFDADHSRRKGRVRQS